MAVSAGLFADALFFPLAKEFTETSIKLLISKTEKKLVNFFIIGLCKIGLQFFTGGKYDYANIVIAFTYGTLNGIFNNQATRAHPETGSISKEFNSDTVVNISLLPVFLFTLYRNIFAPLTLHDGGTRCGRNTVESGT